MIFVVVDRLTMFTLFLFFHPYTAAKVATLFVHCVFKLHGMLVSIVNDRDTVFTSLFWSEFFRLHGTTLAMSTAYHPQSNGPTKFVIKNLE